MVCSFEIREVSSKQAIGVEFWDLLTDKRNQSMAELIKPGPFLWRSTANSCVNSFFFQETDMTKEKKT